MYHNQPVYFSWVILMLLSGVVTAGGDHDAAREVEQALGLEADIQRGKAVYMTCAVCHTPEGWESADGFYPQIAGQLARVTIKQLADIRARNRDTPTMFPFTMLEFLSIQDIADVAAYVSMLPMNPLNSTGPGTDLDHGKRQYVKYCADCHGDKGQGIEKDMMPLIQGQHYQYLVRQFEWIRQGKRRNADKEMVEQIKGFTPRDVSAMMDYVSRLRPPATRLAAADWRNPHFPKFVRNDPPTNLITQ